MKRMNRLGAEADIKSSSMSTIQPQLLPRDPSNYGGPPGHQFLCKHRECPLYKAPPCFSRRLEYLLGSMSCYGTNYPDWKQFARHFNINIPVGERGVVDYWVKGHQDKDQHTIQCILDFAEKEGHSPLLHQFEDLIKIHEQTSPGHVCTSDPAYCFKLCLECKSRHVSMPEISLKTITPVVTSQRRHTDSSSSQRSSYSDDNVSLKRHSSSSSNVFLDQDPPNFPANDLPTTPPDPSLDPPLGPDEVIHFLAPLLFVNEYPYKLFLGNYWILEPIIVLFLAFQTIASIFITLCEEGGAYSVFHDGLDISEFINRIITLLLRILVRVVAPFVFYRQLCSMSEAEKALEVKRKKDDYTLPRPKPVPCKQHVTLWSIVSHAVIFSVILLYLGAFLTSEERFKDNSICIKELFQVQMPLLGMRLLVFFDCLSCFFILMLLGLVKDCYCIENRLSSTSKMHFDVVRKRWFRIDAFCYAIPPLLVLFTVVSLSYDKPITPAPDHQLDPGELEIWCFWMIVLSLLLFFGSATNWTAKIVTVIGNIVALCSALVFTVFQRVGKASFPPGSVVILLYCHLSMTTANLLYCLTKAHARHKSIKSKRFWLSLTFLVLLSVSLMAIVIREVIGLAKYLSRNGHKSV